MKPYFVSMPSKSHLPVSTLLFVLCFLASGCSSDSPIPHAWGKAELSDGAIASKIKEAAKMKDVRWSTTQTEGGNGSAQKGAATQMSATKTYEGTGTGENGHTYKIKSRYTYSESGGSSTHDFQWDADDSQGDQKSGTYKGP
jgi:hypothetical protein